MLSEIQLLVQTGPDIFATVLHYAFIPLYKLQNFLTNLKYNSSGEIGQIL